MGGALHALQIAALCVAASWDRSGSTAAVTMAGGRLAGAAALALLPCLGADDFFVALAGQLGVKKLPDKVCAERGGQWDAGHPGCKYRTPKRTAASAM